MPIEIWPITRLAGTLVLASCGERDYGVEEAEGRVELGAEPFPHNDRLQQ